ncbi:MAG: hypothetical protein HXY23_12950, partial [Parvularculaceae bacterium]|nr:hypothetical protein [Parvularculaceae bacterium]
MIAALRMILLMLSVAAGLAPAPAFAHRGERASQTGYVEAGGTAFRLARTGSAAAAPTRIRADHLGSAAAAAHAAGTVTSRERVRAAAAAFSACRRSTGSMASAGAEPAPKPFGEEFLNPAA